MNIAPPDPLTPLSGDFLPQVLTFVTTWGVWYTRIVASDARLLEIKSYVTVLDCSKNKRPGVMLLFGSESGSEPSGIEGGSFASH